MHKSKKWFGYYPFLQNSQKRFVYFPFLQKVICVLCIFAKLVMRVAQILFIFVSGIKNLFDSLLPHLPDHMYLGLWVRDLEWTHFLQGSQRKKNRYGTRDTYTVNEKQLTYMWNWHTYIQASYSLSAKTIGCLMFLRHFPKRISIHIHIYTYVCKMTYY